MALAMMEAIADFSRKNQATTVHLVRVVVFQADMVPTYLSQLDQANKPDSSILDMITAPFRSISNTVKGRSTWVYVISRNVYSWITCVQSVTLRIALWLNLV